MAFNVGKMSPVVTIQILNPLNTAVRTFHLDGSGDSFEGVVPVQVPWAYCAGVGYRAREMGRLIEAARTGLSRIPRVDFARRIGLSHQTIFAAEKGHVRPTLQTVCIIVKALYERVPLGRFYELYNEDLRGLPFYDRVRKVYRVSFPPNLSLEQILKTPIALFIRDRMGEGSNVDLARRSMLNLGMIDNIMRGGFYDLDVTTLRKLARALSVDLDLIYLAAHKEIPAFLTVVDGETGKVLSRPTREMLNWERMESVLRSPPSRFARAFRRMRGGRTVREQARRLGLATATCYGFEQGLFFPLLDVLCRLRERFTPGQARELYAARYPEPVEWGVVDPEEGVVRITTPEGWSDPLWEEKRFDLWLTQEAKRLGTLTGFAEGLGIDFAYFVNLLSEIVLDIPYPLVKKIAEAAGADPGFVAVLAHPEIFDFFRVVDRRNGAEVSFRGAPALLASRGRDDKRHSVTLLALQEPEDEVPPITSPKSPHIQRVILRRSPMESREEFYPGKDYAVYFMNFGFNEELEEVVEEILRLVLDAVPNRPRLVVAGLPPLRREVFESLRNRIRTHLSHPKGSDQGSEVHVLLQSNGFYASIRPANGGERLSWLGSVEDVDDRYIDRIEESERFIQGPSVSDREISPFPVPRELFRTALRQDHVTLRELAQGLGKPVSATRRLVSGDLSELQGEDFLRLGRPLPSLNLRWLALHADPDCLNWFPTAALREFLSVNRQDLWKVFQMDLSRYRFPRSRKGLAKAARILEVSPEALWLRLHPHFLYVFSLYDPSLRHPFALKKEDPFRVLQILEGFRAYLPFKTIPPEVLQEDNET